MEPDQNGLVDMRVVRLRLERTLEQLEGKDYSIKRIADRTGFNSESIRRWLCGINDPKLAFIIRVCQVYELNPAYLLMGEMPTRTAEATHAELKTKVAALIAGITQSLDGEAPSPTPGPADPIREPPSVRSDAITPGKVRATRLAVERPMARPVQGPPGRV